MARYRKIDPRMWSDAKFRRLSAAPANAQTLFIWLLTCPCSSSVPGLIRARPGGIADDLGWTKEALLEAFREVFQQGMAEADWEAGLVYIPKALAHNIPESPNVIRGWGTWLRELPECPLLERAKANFGAFFRERSPSLSEAWEEVANPSAKPTRKASPKASGKASPKAMAIQEHEQEQEQEDPPYPPRQARPQEVEPVGQKGVTLPASKQEAQEGPPKASAGAETRAAPPTQPVEPPRPPAVVPMQAFLDAIQATKRISFDPPKGQRMGGGAFADPRIRNPSQLSSMLHHEQVEQEDLDLLCRWLKWGDGGKGGWWRLGGGTEESPYKIPIQTVAKSLGTMLAQARAWKETTGGHDPSVSVRDPKTIGYHDCQSAEDWRREMEERRRQQVALAEAWKNPTPEMLEEEERVMAEVERCKAQMARNVAELAAAEVT